MTTAVEVANNHLPTELSTEQVELVKRTIAKGASDDELALFLAQVSRTQLDPFARQIYCIARYDGKAKRDVFQTQVSIDGARLVAQRTGDYAGQTPTYWTGDGKEWAEVWLADEAPKAAKVGVYRRGFAEPMWAVATWDQYVQTYKRDGNVHVSPMWQKMGPLMLGKCAEMLALRKAFPMELSGLYSPEEMAQADIPPAAPSATTNGAAPTRNRVRAAPQTRPASEDDDEIAEAEIVPEASATAYSDMSNSEITELLKARNLPVGGSKGERIGRLLESDGGSTVIADPETGEIVDEAKCEACGGVGCEACAPF